MNMMPMNYSRFGTYGGWVGWVGWVKRSGTIKAAEKLIEA
jgi:hypothetical protein